MRSMGRSWIISTKEGVPDPVAERDGLLKRSMPSFSRGPRVGYSLVVLASLFLCGCGKGDDPKTPSSLVAGKRAVDSNGGHFVVMFQTSPDPVPMNESFTVTFSVAPKVAAKGTPDLTVEIDARMPAHGHGMNKTPKLIRASDGSYKAEGLLFHMPGHWELYFDLSEGGRTERAQVDVDLK